MALRCLNAASAITPDSPEVHEQAVAFRVMLNGASDLSPKVAEVLKAEFKNIDESAGVKKFNEAFGAKNKGSARHAVAVIKAKKLLGEDQSKCEKELVGLVSLDSIEFGDAEEILETLKSWRSSGVAGFKKAAQAKWPEVTRLA